LITENHIALFLANVNTFFGELAIFTKISPFSTILACKIDGLGGVDSAFLAAPW